MRPSEPPDPVGVDDRLGYNEMEMMLAYLVRSRPLFLLAQGTVSPVHFSEPFEAGHRVLWQSLLEYHEQHGGLPSRPALAAIVQDNLERAYDVQPETRQDLLDFLDAVWEIDASCLAENYGQDLLRRFLRDREFTDPLKAYVRELNGHSPKDLTAFLEELGQRAQRILTVGSNPTGRLDDAEDEEAQPLDTLGWKFLDEIFDGGVAPVEVDALIGAISSGKTTMSGQICVGIARREHERVIADPRHVPASAVFVTCETPKHEVRCKFLACAACVQTSRLRKTKFSEWATHLSSSSRPGSLLEYERRLFSGQVPLPGELERMAELAWPLQDYFRILEMRPTQQNRRVGYGYVQEIALHLENLLRSGEVKRLGLVVIDYAKLMCKRVIQARGLDETRHMRTLLSSVADDVRTNIAEPFGCPVIVNHQLAGQENKRASGYAHGIASGAECTMFGENMDFVITFGVKDQRNGCIHLTSAKTRRADGRKHSTILQLTDYSRLDCVDDRFRLDPIGSGIVSSEAIDRLADAAAPEPRASLGLGRRSRW